MRQRQFIAAYQRGITATQAAIEAGYSPRSAAARGYHLLAHPQVAAELARVQDKLAEEAGYNGDKCMAELDKAIEFAIATKQPNAYVKAIELRARLAGLLRDKIDITVERVDLAGALAEATERRLRLPCDPVRAIEGECVALPSVKGASAVDKESIRQVEQRLWGDVRKTFTPDIFE